jgi:hypothetical protein
MPFFTKPQQRELWLVASTKRFLAAANDRDFAVFGDERLRHGASYRHSSRRMPCELTKR